MGCFVRGDKNGMGCFVRGGKSMRDVLSGVSKNGMGCFVLGCFVLHSLIIHKWSLCDMLLRRLLNVFVNKVDPDQAALVRAA